MMAMDMNVRIQTSGENLTSKLTRGLYRDPHRFNEIDETTTLRQPLWERGEQ